MDRVANGVAVSFDQHLHAAIDRAKGAQVNHLSPWRDFPWVGVNARLPITQLSSHGPLSEEAIQKTVDSGRTKMANYYVTHQDRLKKAANDNRRAAIEAKIHHCEPCDKSFSSDTKLKLHNRYSPGRVLAAAV